MLKSLSFPMSSPSFAAFRRCVLAKPTRRHVIKLCRRGRVIHEISRFHQACHNVVLQSRRQRQAIAVRLRRRSAHRAGPRGYHIFRIDGYSLTKNFPTGERINSSTFVVGGHRWLLRYEPNSKVADYIGIDLLYLDETVPKAVKAQYQTTNSVLPTRWWRIPWNWTKRTASTAAVVTRS